ncbi:MAG: prepilin-type N-terminal cleavage/methylation domain-containing protein [Gammaproteobacteria bacterium]|nr:prepilin-type N-terminal cleavage/methylation domain-containing protein [Gammaproteobacteria bacterium]MDH3750237.1 prepilin-type N-terminal cleavage/methylation domain-containing protein [Gammaproteobacteria bacterium]
MVGNGNKEYRWAAGFTLLELLVVLAIAGMLVALVPAAVSTVVPGTKARVAALDLASTLRDARNLAISQSRTVDVEFDLESASYSIAGSPIQELPRGMALVIQERSGYVSETRRVARFPFDQQKMRTLRFYPDGSSSGVHVRLGPQDGGYIVAVDWLLGGASVSRASTDAS